MSEQLTAAAEAMGIPEPLVERSAAARAAEAGTGTEEILAAWAGGEAATAPATEPEKPAETEAPEKGPPEKEAPKEPEPEPEPPEIVIEKPAESPVEAPAPAAPVPDKPPVLVGARDNPMVVMAAAVGLFVVVFLVGFVGPSFQGQAPGARTSQIAYSAQALEGLEIYSSLNCDSCHTQMVRPVVADVGLGAATVHDSNQVLGTRRFGPDLSNVGARISDSQLAAIVTGLGDHPAYGLRADDLEALVSYLAESVTSEGS